MYTSQDLKLLIARIGVERKGKELCGKCPLCGHNSLHLNKGRKKVSVVICNSVECGVDKKQEILNALGLTWDDFGPELDTKDIEAIWQEVFPEAKSTDTSNRLDLANSSICNSAYTYLVKHGACKLIKSHREWLETRGLPYEYAESLGYGSTPSENISNSIAVELFKALGSDLFKVPGFVNQNGKVKIRLVENGIFHPCRNYEGEIVSIKIRKPNATARDRFNTISSAYCNGPSAIAVCHFPLGVNKLLDTSIVWITEGERKADILFKYKQVAVIGIPGTHNTAKAFEALDKLQCKTVVFALDKDRAGEFATTKLRYEHYIRELEHRDFMYADWDIGEKPKEKDKK